ncbi:hypothetical protein AB0H43_20460, partial [Hamadaea sp. NPDC050747]|uniref:hypothetical protein n=1 Tax=Hamadaea sp. NPDC050747 TaxID=3155789 RepID=UPI0033DF5A55
PALDSRKFTSISDLIRATRPADDYAKFKSQTAGQLFGLTELLRTSGPALDSRKFTSISDLIRATRPADDYAKFKSQTASQLFGLTELLRTSGPTTGFGRAVSFGAHSAEWEWFNGLADGGSLGLAQVRTVGSVSAMVSERDRFADFGQDDRNSGIPTSLVDSGGESTLLEPARIFQPETTSGLTVIDNETLGFVESLLLQVRLCLPSIERVQQVSNVASGAAILLIATMVLQIGYPEVWKAIVDQNGMIALYLTILVLIGQAGRR